MKNIGALQAGGYGIMVFSPDKLNRFLKDRKCRAKKYISYFDKNKEVFYDLVKAGILLPFYRICRFEYEIFVAVDEPEADLPQGYDVVYHYSDFYITTGIGKLCFSCFDYLEYHKDMIDEGRADFGEEIPTGPEEVMEWYHHAIGLDMDEGIYQFNLYGLKRKEMQDRESKNYAFLFVFRKTGQPVNDNFNKCDNDRFDFDIRNYEKSNGSTTA